MRGRLHFLWALLFIYGSVEAAILAPIESNETSASQHLIAVQLPKPAQVHVDIYSPDRDLIVTLPAATLATGRHHLTWDGRDSEGAEVPAEAYVPVATAHFEDGSEEVDDPRQYSGGEVIESIANRLQSDHSIYFQLPHAARILVRAGITSGPLLKTVVNWQPRPAGANLVRWDGFDHDRIIDLREDARLRVLVTGYRLPLHAVIVHDGADETYAAYRLRRFGNTPAEVPAASEAVMERNGQRLSPFSLHSRSRDIEPRITMEFAGEIKRNQAGIPLLEKPTPVRVDMHADDQMVLDETLYEVAFFGDLNFVSEQEQGYVPLTWIFDPTQYAPGPHTLTVNVSAFRGQVGVKTLRFEVPPRP